MQKKMLKEICNARTSKIINKSTHSPRGLSLIGNCDRPCTSTLGLGDSWRSTLIQWVVTCEEPWSQRPSASSDSLEALSSCLDCK